MITKLRKKPVMLLKKKKVAAYCRVSTLSEEQESSYAMQVSYYTRMIQSHPEWEFAGVYADHGISGTGTKKRVGFQELMKSADEGKIDLTNRIQNGSSLASMQITASAEQEQRSVLAFRS